MTPNITLTRARNSLCCWLASDKTILRYLLRHRAPLEAGRRTADNCHGLWWWRTCLETRPRCNLVHLHVTALGSAAGLSDLAVPGNQRCVSAPEQTVCRAKRVSRCCAVLCMDASMCGTALCAPSRPSSSPMIHVDAHKTCCLLRLFPRQEDRTVHLVSPNRRAAVPQQKRPSLHERRKKQTMHVLAAMQRLLGIERHVGNLPPLLPVLHGQHSPRMQKISSPSPTSFACCV